MSIANPFCLINNQWRRDIHSHAPTQTQTNDAGERKWSGHYSDYTHSIHRNHTKQLKSLPQTTPPTTTLSIQTRYSASNNSEMSQAQHSNCWDWIFEHIPFMPQFVLFLSLPLWHNRNKKKNYSNERKFLLLIIVLCVHAATTAAFYCLRNTYPDCELGTFVLRLRRKRIKSCENHLACLSIRVFHSSDCVERCGDTKRATQLLRTLRFPLSPPPSPLNQRRQWLYCELIVYKK